MSIAVLDRNQQASRSDLVEHSIVRFQGADPVSGTPHFMESKIKNCQFGLEYKPMVISTEPGMLAPTMPLVTAEQAQASAAEEAIADAPMASEKSNEHPLGRV